MQKKTWVTTIVCVAVVTIINVVNINLAKPDLSSISLSLNRMESIASESSENSNWQQVNSCATDVSWTYYYYAGDPLYLESATKTSACVLGSSSSCTKGTEVYDYDGDHQPHLVITDVTTKNCTSW